MNIWIFETSEDAYNFTMSDSRVKVSEDILVIPHENVVGIADVYPFAISEETGALHCRTMYPDVSDWITWDSSKYTYKDIENLVNKAKEIARTINNSINKRPISETYAMLQDIFDAKFHDGWKTVAQYNEANVYTEDGVKALNDISKIKEWIEDIENNLSYDNLSENDKTRLDYVVNSIINNP